MSVQLHTPEQAGEVLGVTAKSVYRLIALGELRAVDVAVSGTRSKTRVRDDDLQDFINLRTRQATAAS